MSNEILEGRYIFSPRWTTIFKIEKIAPPAEFVEDQGETMELIDCRTNLMTVAHWVSEIGEEFQLIPEDYPTEKIYGYCEASNAKARAEEVMMNIEIEIGLEQPDIKELEKAAKRIRREEGAFSPDSVK